MITLHIQLSNVKLGNGKIQGDLEFDPSLLPELLQSAGRDGNVPAMAGPSAKGAKSTAMTPTHAERLLQNINPSSALCVRTIVKNGGKMCFDQMKQILSVDLPDEEAAHYIQTHYLRGINKSMRAITRTAKGKNVALVVWDDDDWIEGNYDECFVYINGTALTSLQEVIAAEND